MSVQSHIAALGALSTAGHNVSVEAKSHPRVQVLMLNNVPAAALEEQENVQLHFVVLKVLRNGFSRANWDPEDKKKKGAKGGKVERGGEIYSLSSNGVLFARSYERVGMAGKGDATEDGACVVPGMVMQCTVFRDKEKGWGDIFQAADSAHPFDGVPAFSQAVVMLASRSTAAKATLSGGLLQLKELQPLLAPSVFGGAVFTDSLFARTNDESCDRRIGFMDLTKMGEGAGYGANQEYIQMMLSQTRHVLELRPGPDDVDIGRNADGTLYVQVFNGLSKFGVEVGRVRLHDPHSYMASMGLCDWVENLLRFALATRALRVVFTYDSMRDGMGGDEQIVDGMCMISVSALLAAVISSEQVDPGTLKDDTAAAFFRGGSADDFELYWTGPVDAESGVAEYGIVVSKRVSTREQVVETDVVAGPCWAPVLCHPKSAVDWGEGRLVRVFQQGVLVFYFVASVGRSCEVGAKRKFNALDEGGMDGLL